MLAHPPEKSAPIKKNFQTQKMKIKNKKKERKSFPFFIFYLISQGLILLDKLNFSEDDRVRDLNRFPLNNFKFF